MINSFQATCRALGIAYCCRPRSVNCAWSLACLTPAPKRSTVSPVTGAGRRCPYPPTAPALKCSCRCLHRALLATADPVGGRISPRSLRASLLSRLQALRSGRFMQTRASTAVTFPSADIPLPALPALRRSFGELPLWSCFLYVVKKTAPRKGAQTKTKYEDQNEQHSENPTRPPNPQPLNQSRPVEERNRQGHVLQYHAGTALQGRRGMEVRQQLRHR